VTQGERGVLWYDESGEVRHLPALAVPQARVRDTSGAGDVFHGAYVYSYLDNPFKGWEQHFRFGQRAAAHKIQHLGNEAGLPTVEDIKEIAREFDQETGVEPRPARESVAAMPRSR
jgi:sugar/nucleoside kinase (ribokinase family)